jgi:hypothetical protein
VLKLNYNFIPLKIKINKNTCAPISIFITLCNSLFILILFIFKDQLYISISFIYYLALLNFFIFIIIIFIVVYASIYNFYFTNFLFIDNFFIFILFLLTEFFLFCGIFLFLVKIILFSTFGLNYQYLFKFIHANIFLMLIISLLFLCVTINFLNICFIIKINKKFKYNYYNLFIIRFFIISIILLLLLYFFFNFINVLERYIYKILIIVIRIVLDLCIFVCSNKWL